MAWARFGVWLTSEQRWHFNNHTSLLKSCIFTHNWDLIIFFHTASGKFSRCPLSASRRSFVQTPWMISLSLKTGSGTDSLCVWGCSPHQPVILGTPAACLTIQLNSATWRLHHIPPVKCSVLQDCLIRRPKVAVVLLSIHPLLHRHSTHVPDLPMYLPLPQLVIVLIFRSERLHLLAYQRAREGRAPLLVSLVTDETTWCQFSL